MATTDAKPGFRLPWSSDRNEPADPADAAPDAARDPATGPTSHPQQEIETPEMIDAAPAATDHEADVETPTPSEPAAEAVVTPTFAQAAAPASVPAVQRRPNKFMADLTKAMAVAAEAAREDTLARFNAEAKTHIEAIHTDSATEATDLRKGADDDVAKIREWSKAEIARIREETDERISHRKGTLEQEIEEHAAAIEARIERVQARVNSFETEMGAFFERLLAEEDPTRFAAMAESLPEPPPFDGPAPEREPAWYTAPIVEPPAVEETPPQAASAEAETVAVEAVAVEAVAVEEHDASTDAATGFTPDPAWDSAPAAEADAPGETRVETPVETPVEATVAEPPAAETVVDEATPTPAEDAGDLFSIRADEGADPGDPRLSMLGLTPDFAAAEAEAASYTPSEDGSEVDVPEIGDDAIAARLAGLVPEGDPNATIVTTRVVVTGLISVASIAGFKRHLSRAPGVQSVGVSSGPEGEFVFAVGHGSDISVRDIIPTLPGFSARVTAEHDGDLVVSARDPEAES